MKESAEMDFCSWFAGSRVVDEKGRPLRVYRGEHGADTSRYLSSRLGSVVFTDAPEVASLYAMDPNDWRETAMAPRVLVAHLRIAHPVIDNRDDPFVDLCDIEDRVGRDDAIRIARKFAAHIEATGNWMEGLSREFSCVGNLLDTAPSRVGELYFDAFRLFDDPEEVARFKDAGFDGAVHIGNGEGAGTLEFRVFDPEQVRPAINYANQGGKT